jgi:hypothetical protein
MSPMKALAAAAFGFGLACIAGDVSAAGTAAPGAAAPSDGFDRALALDAMNAVDVTHCKKAKGPKGEGHVIVTFAPAGIVAAANVDKAPFAGTKVGQCIAKEFKKAKIPAFKGEPVNVGKKFKIE